jgi:predicted transcriptional regulator
MAMSFLRITILIGCISALSLNVARAANVGDTLEPVKLVDAEKQPSDIPDLGNKVLVIIYSDADRANLNDPLADAILEAELDDDLYRGIGIANLKDSKAPNFIIRSIIRGKIEKYDSTILTDPDLRLPQAWDLGDCNNDSIAMLVDKDRKLVRTQRGGVRGEDISTWIAQIESLLASPTDALAPKETPAVQVAGEEASGGSTTTGVASTDPMPSAEVASREVPDSQPESE